MAWQNTARDPGLREPAYVSAPELEGPDTFLVDLSLEIPGVAELYDYAAEVKWCDGKLMLATIYKVEVRRDGRTNHPLNEMHPLGRAIAAELRWHYASLKGQAWLRETWRELADDVS